MRHLLILLLLISCIDQKLDPETQEQKSCVCPEIYQPVCANSKTYSNACIAICRGEKGFKKGQCK